MARYFMSSRPASRGLSYWYWAPTAVARHRASSRHQSSRIRLRNMPLSSGKCQARQAYTLNYNHSRVQREDDRAMGFVLELWGMRRAFSHITALIAAALLLAGGAALAGGLAEIRAGELAAARGDPAAAEAAYTRALDSGELNRTGRALALNNRGVARRAQGRLDQALADYQAALKLKPEYAQAYYNAAQARLALGQNWRALANYDKALELRPDYVQAWHNRGILWCSLGRYRRGLADFRRALELKPDFMLAYLNAGHARLILGQPWRAVANYDQAIALRPSLAVAYARRAEAYKVLGLNDKARADLARARELGWRVKPPDQSACFMRTVRPAAPCAGCHPRRPR
eukprot:TRINITY_DN5528_c0_g1_i1.p2 TRINITY_DN5528_c0_g1~~TRINITY_DN5528_c0_g1_i1.p2  ORF type:complete len:345 (+),score=106.92 TRINITY_DN5528_c0_g1_i1:257-1291(+)